MDLSVIGNVLLWSLLVWLPTTLISLAFIRLIFGVRIRTLIEEVEERQTAAIGAVFFWVSLGFSMLLSRTVADPPSQEVVPLGVAFGWFGVALLITLLLFFAGVFLVFGSLAQRKREGVLVYIRREMREEHNLALAFIMGALFIVPVIVSYHMAL